MVGAVRWGIGGRAAGFVFDESWVVSGVCRSLLVEPALVSAWAAADLV